MAQRATPKVSSGSEPTTRDRGQVEEWNHGSTPTGRTKAQVRGGMSTGTNDPTKTRRAPKTDRLV